MRTLSLLAALTLIVPAFGFVAAGDKDKDLEGIKCPLSGRAIDAEKAAEYKGAEVYFCCGNCLAKFKADPDKFASKANAQLVATKQAEQTCCPLSGRPVNPEKKTEVAGAEVALCCGNCLAKVEGAEEAEQITLIFAEKPFKKAFKVKKD